MHAGDAVCLNAGAGLSSGNLPDICGRQIGVTRNDGSIYQRDHRFDCATGQLHEWREVDQVERVRGPLPAGLIRNGYPWGEFRDAHVFIPFANETSCVKRHSYADFKTGGVRLSRQEVF